MEDLIDIVETTHTEEAIISSVAAADHSPSGGGGNKHCQVQLMWFFFPFAEDSIAGEKARQSVLEPSPIGRDRQVAVEASVAPFFP